MIPLQFKSKIPLQKICINKSKLIIRGYRIVIFVFQNSKWLIEIERKQQQQQQHQNWSNRTKKKSIEAFAFASAAHVS